MSDICIDPIFEEDDLLKDHEYDNINDTFDNTVLEFNQSDTDISLNNISGEFKELSVNAESSIIGTEELQANGVCSPVQSTIGNTVSIPLSKSVNPSLKRSRGSDSSFESGNPIKIRRTFAEMFPMAAIAAAAETYVIHVLPNVDGATVFTEDQLRRIGVGLNRALFSAENFGELNFEFSGPESGKYRMICANKTTRDWAIDAVPHLEGLWQGAKLRIVQPGPPPVLRRSTVNFAMPVMEPNDFFNIIQAQNPTINTSNCKLFNRNKPAGGKQLWIIGVDENSIAALRDIGSRPYCGMTRVKIDLPN